MDNNTQQKSQRELHSQNENFPRINLGKENGEFNKFLPISDTYLMHMSLINFRKKRFK